MTEHGWFDEDWDDSDEDDRGTPARRSTGTTTDPTTTCPTRRAPRCGPATDALAVLLDLVGPERAGAPALWFVLLDAQDRTAPAVVLPISDVPMRADRAVARRLVARPRLGPALDDAPGGSVVVGLVRAAGGDLGAFEASWVAVAARRRRRRRGAPLGGRRDRREPGAGARVVSGPASGRRAGRRLVDRGELLEASAPRRSRRRSRAAARACARPR